MPTLGRSASHADIARRSASHADPGARRGAGVEVSGSLGRLVLPERSRRQGVAGQGAWCGLLGAREEEWPGMNKVPIFQATGLGKGALKCLAWSSARRLAGHSPRPPGPGVARP